MKAYLFCLLIISTFLFSRSEAVCGDRFCDPFSSETRVSCPSDCFCGDEVCDYSEHISLCPSDCGANCGDLLCLEPENTRSCPIDCIEKLPTCGNAKCDIGETTVNCFTDCPTEDAGDGIHYVLYVFNPLAPESNYTCTVSVFDVAGNLTDQYEMVVVANGKTVPDAGLYQFVAHCDNSASSQATYQLVDLGSEISFLAMETEQCGNGLCLSPEDFESCPQDCIVDQFCGDGRCLSPENSDSCPQDCGCSPNCFGRNCGSDGCGGTCGFCDGECVNGICQTTCSPNCFGRICGADGCGGSCGTCFTGQECIDGICVTVCSPTCFGRTCGSDGCGGSCGTCFSGQECINGVCQTVCSPNCFERSCGGDGCGGSCGTCFTGQECIDGACITICTPNCFGRNCGDNGCGGSCGTCPSGTFCNSSGVCQNVCTPSCVGRVCGSDGCGGSCGSCPTGLACFDGVCANTTCSCAERECGYPNPGCEHACGLCAYDQYCTSEGLCSSAWSILYNVVIDEAECPDDNTECMVGPFALLELQEFLQAGDEVVVGPGHYCGGFTVSKSGVRFTGRPGAVIVPCSSQWWEPAPPNCQAIDGASGTPCSLANNLITLNASSVVISGFEFNGQIPNPLFNGTAGVATYSADGTAIGAARAIANFQAVSGRQVAVNPVTGVLICNNTFVYFEEAAVRVKVAIVLIQYNSFSKIGTVGSVDDVPRRQGKTEKQRGSRKNKPGASVVLDDSGGEVVDNDISDCDYGGMDGGDYPPSSFPFKKRSCVVDVTSPRHTQFDYTTWSRNLIKNTLFGGVIVESKSAGKQEVFGNVIAETARGLIVENITSLGGGDNFENGGLVIRENNMQGVGVASWTWRTDATTFVRENYQYVQTGIHLISCNPYESNQPLSSLYVNVSESNMDSAAAAFYVQDEPADNPICSTSTPVSLQLEARGGKISRSDVGLQTAGNRLDASDVSVFTDNVGTKVRMLPNSLGAVASPQQVAPNCPPTCSGHGQCGGINICNCENGYYDIDCSDQICGDRYCTVSENPTNCPDDCLFRIKTTRVTLQFGGMIPTPSCCSVAAA